MARTKANKRNMVNNSVSTLDNITVLNLEARHSDDEEMENYEAENTEIENSEDGDELSIQALEGDQVMQNQGGVDNEVEFLCRDDLEIIDHQGNFLRIKKGATRPKDVWNLPKTERIKIHCNSFGQPVKKGGRILGGWLGSYARKASLCPVNYINWRKMPRSFITMLLKQTRKRFFVPEDTRVNGWIKKKTARNWKNYRHKLKKKYMLAGCTEAQVANKRPPNGITQQQWRDLVNYWFGEDCQRFSEIGKAARATLNTPHTTGSKSFARIRDEHEQKKGKQPGRIEFFTITHTRKSGRLDDTAAKFVDDANNMVQNEAAALGSPKSVIEIENQVYTKLKDKGSKVTGFGMGVTLDEANEVHTAQNALAYGVSQLENRENVQEQIEAMKNQYELKLAEMRSQYEEKIVRMETQQAAT